MLCPVCRIDMIVVEHKKIELDHCPRCAGVWFDSGELELLIAQARPPSLTEAESKEKRRKCPICGRKMKKVLVGEKPKVPIDACPQDDGLWFDGGELDQLLAQVSEPGQSDLVSFLGEVFQARKKA